MTRESVIRMTPNKAPNARARITCLRVTVHLSEEGREMNIYLRKFWAKMGFLGQIAKLLIGRE
jgi:hypothetical protein